MLQNIYTEYLKQRGWVEVDPLSYKKASCDIELFFDTSSQLDVYVKERQPVGSFYLKELNDLIKILEKFNL